MGSGLERGHGDALILRSVRGGAETQIHREGNVKDDERQKATRQSGMHDEAVHNQP